MKKLLALIAIVAFVSGTTYAQTDTTKMKHKKTMKKSKMEPKKTDKTTPM